MPYRLYIEIASPAVESYLMGGFLFMSDISGLKLEFESNRSISMKSGNIRCAEPVYTIYEAIEV